MDSCEYDIAHLSPARPSNVSIKRASVLQGLTGGAFAQALSDRPSLLLLSPTVDLLYGRELRSTIQDFGLSEQHVHVIATGEANKSVHAATEVLQVAHDRALSRDALMIGVGGGILLDIVGFAASQFRRGIGHVKVGSTLVAQVDAAVGIKCGVNLGAAKNLLGAFHPPELVLTDGRFLSTLPAREVRCGLAEMIKLGVIADVALFDDLERNGAGLLAPASRDSTSSRQLVDTSASRMVSELAVDPYEQDRRRPVDFGHTISPHLEGLTGYELRHGEAVAIDLALFSVVSNMVGLLPKTELARILTLLRSLGIPTWHDLLADPLFIDQALNGAEAHRGRRLNLPLPAGLGKSLIIEDRVDVGATLLGEAANRLREASR